MDRGTQSCGPPFYMFMFGKGLRFFTSRTKIDQGKAKKKHVDFGGVGVWGGGGGPPELKHVSSFFLFFILHLPLMI